MFTGSLVAIVTPFRRGKVDERALAELIEWQIADGTNGIVPCGTTGESATLSHSEHNRVIELTVEVVRRQTSELAGIPRINDSGVRILHAARALRKVAVGK